MKNFDVYLETGKKRTFAGAIDWPGWCRSAQNEELAFQVLCDYGPRYAAVLRTAQIDFHPPVDAAAFNVVERLEGDISTDFGAPGKIPSADARSFDEAELHRLQALLAACWRAFEQATTAAEGKALLQGPRGGGRDLQKMIQHVLDAESAYIARLGYKLKHGESSHPSQVLAQIRQTLSEAFSAAARGELPAQGPRGGARWPVRYYVRRSAWHVLDHAWEIEDRILD